MRPTGCGTKCADDATDVRREKSPIGFVTKQGPLYLEEKKKGRKVRNTGSLDTEDIVGIEE